MKALKSHGLGQGLGQGFGQGPAMATPAPGKREDETYANSPCKALQLVVCTGEPDPKVRFKGF